LFEENCSALLTLAEIEGTQEPGPFSADQESRLHEGVVLDKDLRSQLHTAPRDLTRRLPPPPSNHRYISLLQKQMQKIPQYIRQSTTATVLEEAVIQAIVEGPIPIHLRGRAGALLLATAWPAWHSTRYIHCG
jgi:hypothetical protein